MLVRCLMGDEHTSRLFHLLCKCKWKGKFGAAGFLLDHGDEGQKALLDIPIFVLFLRTKDVPFAASAGLFVWQAVSIAAKTKKKKKGTEIKIAEVAHLVYDH